MKAFVITLEGHPYSEMVSARCIKSAADFGLKVAKFAAVSRDRAVGVMESHGLRWTWARDNTAHDVCPRTGLKQHPYGALKSKIGCAMSHYLLWSLSVEIGEPLLILEHDAVFMRELPVFGFRGICQINDPRGATPHGKMWSDRMAARGEGIFPKTKIFADDIPDGLAGNSAYCVQPWAAHELIQTYHTLGVWPNDATMCRQLFPYLEELHPFVTYVDQSMSTSSQ